MRAHDVEKGNESPTPKTEHRRDFIKAAGVLAAGGVSAGALSSAQAGQDQPEQKKQQGEGQVSPPPEGFGVAKVVKLTENNLLITEITANLPEKYDVHVSIQPKTPAGEAAGEPIEGCVFECGIDF